MGGLLDPDLLLEHGQAVDAQVGHRFLGFLNRLLIQLHPAGVRQVDKVAAGASELLQVALRQLHPLLLPLGGDGEPVDAAAVNDQLWFEPLGLEEKPLELRVTQVLGLRLVRPCGVQALEEKRIGVPDPKSRLWREPIKPLQPVDG